MNVKEMKRIAVGDEVRWNDPDDDISSGDYYVQEIATESGIVEDWDSMVVIRNGAGSVAEVFVSELG